MEVTVVPEAHRARVVAQGCDRRRAPAADTKCRVHRPLPGRGSRITPRHEHHARMRQLHGLRRPRGAGGVDERQHIVALADRARRPSKRKPRDCSRRAISDSVIVPGPNRRPPARCARPRACVQARTCGRKTRSVTTTRARGTLQQVIDLLRGQRVVDRECDRSEVHASSVGSRANSGRLTSISAIVSPRPGRRANAGPFAIARMRSGILGEGELDAAVQSPVAQPARGVRTP